MGRTKLRQIKVSLHFVHSRTKEKVSCFQLPRWFSPGPPVSSTNKTDHHDITEILLKVALNTIKQIGFVCLLNTDTLGFLMRILNYQMSPIKYVLLSKDICKGVKRVIIDKGGLFYIHSDHFIIQIVFNTSPIKFPNNV
jgi:hypothetical protein